MFSNLLDSIRSNRKRILVSLVSSLIFVFVLSWVISLLQAFFNSYGMLLEQTKTIQNGNQLIYIAISFVFGSMGYFLGHLVHLARWQKISIACFAFTIFFFAGSWVISIFQAILTNWTILFQQTQSIQSSNMVIYVAASVICFIIFYLLSSWILDNDYDE